MTVTKVVLDLPVVVGHVDHDLLDAVTCQMLDQVLQNRLAQDGDHGLGHALGQWTNTGSLARSQNQCLCHDCLNC